MEKFNKIQRALLLQPELLLDTYVWIYEDHQTEKYYVSSNEIDIMDRYNDRDDEFDYLVAEGKICNILFEYSQEEAKLRRERK